MKYHFTLSRMAIISSAGKNVEESEPWYIDGGNLYGSATLENSLAVSFFFLRFIKNKKIEIYLFIYGCTGSSLQHTGFL